MRQRRDKTIVKNVKKQVRLSSSLYIWSITVQLLQSSMNYLIRVGLCLWLALACGFGSAAQPGPTARLKKYDWKTGTSPGGYTYKYLTGDPMQARFYTLKNGLSVMLSVNKKEPRIFTFIPTRAGSNTDPRTNTGLAHYLEHMLFKGTDKVGTLDWSKEKLLLDKVDALYEQYNTTKDEAKRKAIYDIGA